MQKLVSSIKINDLKTIFPGNESAAIRTDSSIRTMEIILKLIKNYTYGDFEKF